MREYTVPILDERTEQPKGTLTLKARDKWEMQLKADEWMNAHPGYMVDCLGATSREIVLEDVGNVVIE